MSTTDELAVEQAAPSTTASRDEAPPTRIPHGLDDTAGLASDTDAWGGVVADAGLADPPQP